MVSYRYFIKSFALLKKDKEKSFKKLNEFSSKDPIEGAFLLRTFFKFDDPEGSKFSEITNSYARSLVYYLLLKEGTAINTLLYNKKKAEKVLEAMKKRIREENVIFLIKIFSGLYAVKASIYTNIENINIALSLFTLFAGIEAIKTGMNYWMRKEIKDSLKVKEKKI